MHNFYLLLLLVWHAPLGVRSAKRRHQSPEWRISMKAFNRIINYNLELRVVLAQWHQTKSLFDGHDLNQQIVNLLVHCLIRLYSGIPYNYIITHQLWIKLNIPSSALLSTSKPALVSLFSGHPEINSPKCNISCSISFQGFHTSIDWGC